MALNWPFLNLSDIYAIRSQRDLTLNVSIDQLVNPGINLNTVLLEPLNYTSSALSNFAAIIQRGVTRVFLDIYWNNISKTWQLCPFVADVSATAANVTSSDVSNSTVFAYGDRAYTCDTTITFSTFLSDVVKDQWIYPTDNDLDAQTIVLTINLRQAKAAAVVTIDSEAVVATTVSQATTSVSNIQSGNATSSANTAMTTSSQSETLSMQIHNALDRYVYTPEQLSLDRSKALTWNDTAATTQGWPLLKNVLLTEFYRVLISFGDIEVPTAEYNSNLDADSIFSNDDIPTSGAGVISNTSPISSVCSISDGDNIAILSTGAVVKPTWLIASDTSENPFSATTMLQYMNCGFSPVLNATLGSSSDILQYLVTALEYSRWSWEAGQPPAAPQPTPTGGTAPVTDSSGNVPRCAALTVNGWEVENCNSKFKVACRVAKSPYNWTLSQKQVSYYDSVGACTGNTTLSLPRTAVQNTILQSLRQSVVGSDPVWIDMNSIELPVRHIPRNAN
ncbi:hypothetical protein V1525DRAFT_397515 [Lipomyces kononenkoae]|uniref:Uncharacterized protein n=1 Tax=Lipomyces kononenkoae TaxID=34357 RepID=A0ACC3T7T7_LIPKO